MSPFAEASLPISEIRLSAGNDYPLFVRPGSSVIFVDGPGISVALNCGHLRHLASFSHKSPRPSSSQTGLERLLWWFGKKTSPYRQFTSSEPVRSTSRPISTPPLGTLLLSNCYHQTSLSARCFGLCVIGLLDSDVRRRFNSWPCGPNDH